MRFIKLFFSFMVLALMIPCVLRSQNTVPMPTTFEILKPAGRMVYLTEGMVQARNSYGSPVRWVSADDDSVGSSLKYVERHWKIGIASIDGLLPDTGSITVTVHARDPRGEDLIMPYTATLNVHPQIEVNNSDWPIPGISIMMDDFVTAQHAVGDSFEIVYLRRSFNPHTKSRLTIAPAWSDTITARDTSYYLAVPGNVEFQRWFVKGICSSGVDDFGDSWFGLGHQLKVVGLGWGNIHVIDDSFYIQQDVMKDTSFVHGVADSLRLVAWGNTTTTKLYFEFWEWLGVN